MEDKNKMEMQKTNDADWREDISDTSKAILKLADGETEQVVFLNEGSRRTHPDYGTSIVFEVEHNKEEKVFYVNADNFALLRQIKELGKLVGTAVKISRKGSKKSDTRYSIEKIEKK